MNKNRVIFKTVATGLLVLAIFCLGCHSLEPKLCDANGKKVSAEVLEPNAVHQGSVNVYIQQTEDLCQFLLTFHIEPQESIDPVFFLSNAIRGGVGLRIQKVFPQTDAVDVYYDGADRTDGGLVTISTVVHSEIFPSNVFDSRDGRKVLFQQFVCLQDRLPQEEGLYVVTYEHPWETVAGTNMRFSSNKLLYAKMSSQREDELYGHFKDNPSLELASYKMKHPAVSEFAEYKRPVEYFDTIIATNMSCDEVLYYMGSPDNFIDDGIHMSWSYVISPVGEYHIDFVDGKVVKKCFQNRDTVVY